MSLTRTLWVLDPEQRRPVARFLAEHSGRAGMYLDWMAVIDREGQRRCRLDGPFDRSFGPWKKLTSGRPPF